MKRITDGDSLNIIGKKIKEARLAAGFSQKQLSVKLETLAVYVCRGSVSRIESGQRIVNDIEIKAISEILNVSFDYLFSKNEK